MRWERAGTSLRLILVVLVAVALAPGTWVRSETTSRDYDAPLVITPIATSADVSGALELTGLWGLASANDHHHGFSALVALPGGNLLAGSDRGRLLELPFAAGEPQADGAEYRFLPGGSEQYRSLVDLEALTLEPQTGTIWGAFENRNAIERLVPGQKVVARRPPSLNAFSYNSGAETMERLSDGRFLILAEGPEEAHLPNRMGLLFDRDPVDPRAQTVTFRFGSPKGFAPVDAVQLPDRSVLILLRRVEYAIPARFEVAIMRADPAEIMAGQEWTGEIIARLTDPDLAENFEGMAYVAGSDQTRSPRGGAIFLISDDNQSIFQRTLLARLEWRQAPDRSTE